ncbi:hypothetical protein F6V30_14475 [Oryzomonas sagensis]|uniref:Uncharacterized protein n=1 Tax=Oryzomonas sagensis TaxID=2603857 RepID=A0ABQ6TL80_9BACT|nr:hypothetical protein [Oryzomonas sagensis]KAB0669038.1 hypothetical protein F6V30_14475 [Oryzomonas sagensis]
MSSQKTKSKYRSDLFAAIHETASDLFRVGIINKEKMEQFDKWCLANPKLFKRMVEDGYNKEATKK